MRVVFMGTPAFAATILEYLSQQHEVVGVFTRPDAVRGRGKDLVASPVKQKALDLDLPITEATSFSDQAAWEALCAYDPEVICVAAYGVLLPKNVLELPKQGCINVHASLLPRWRGAAPIARAILSGDREAGVCIMKMEEGLDTGPYCVERAMEIGDLSADELEAELADLGATALLTALEHIELGGVVWQQQSEEGMTYAHKIAKGELDPAPTMTAEEIICRCRAASENHPARAVVAGKTVALNKVAYVDPSVLDDTLAKKLACLENGHVIFAAKRLFLGCSDGVIELLMLKPQGKQLMDARSFAAGIQGIKQNGAVWSALS